MGRLIRSALASVLLTGTAMAAPVEVTPATKAAFAPLPARFGVDAGATEKARIDLGRQLYFDARLSKNHDISCNSCHDLQRFGVDGEPTSPGHKGQRGGRNSPTVYNAGGHLAQFWDGRAADLKAQAGGPILNPVEMALPNEAAALAVINSIPEYVAAFKTAFPGEKAVTYDNLALAIATFEQRLVTPDRFDRFLGGDDKALTDAEKKGLNTFAAVGCTACHSGAYLGGHMYQKLGLVKPWPNQADQGRFEVTKAEADKMVFKVPSLRNITKTGPYFHDGKTRTLKDAVKLMALHQLGRTLTEQETREIVTFLGALEGTPPADFIKAPTLPKSTATTPKPDPS